MAYTTIPTLSTDVVDADHLNLLRNNGDFLHDVAQQANAPFVTRQASGIAALDASSLVRVLRMSGQYLHYRIEATGQVLDHWRLFYNGHKVAGAGTGSGPFTGAADLYDPETWPNWVGAWATSTGYDSTAAGDGEIVSNDGSYYKCKQDHTSDASTEPGTGESWETVWTQVGFTFGAFYRAYVDISFDSGNGDLSVEYLYIGGVA